jgi:hypothetical protein
MLRSFVLIVLYSLLVLIGIALATMMAFPVVDWLMERGDRRARRRTERARRLAELARWRHRDDDLGKRGQRAWERLARLGDSRNPSEARDGLWRAWVYAPDDEGWALLTRWLGGQALERLFAAAAYPRVAIADALAAFCARHGLAPEEPAERVRFYALTGQREQRRALDPDGALLAAVYQAADREARAALRQALATDGDLDVVRVVAGAGASSRAADMTQDERQYLIGQLSGRRDWAGLWELAQDLPLLDAIAAVRMIDAGWRPGRQRDHDLFALLTRCDQNSMRSSLEALRAVRAFRIEVPGRVVAGALSAEGQLLAVTTRRTRTKGAISVYRLADGELLTRHQIPVRDFAGLLFSGETLFAVDSSLTELRSRVYRFSDFSHGHGMKSAVDDDSPGIVAVVPHLDGFAAVRRNGLLTFHDCDGRSYSTFPLYGGGGLSRGSGYKRVRAVADPGTGRIVVASWTRVLVLDAREPRQTSIIASSSFGEVVTGVCFRGRDHVILASRRRVWRWRINGPTEKENPYLADGHHLVGVNAGNEVCVLNDKGEVIYLHSWDLYRVDGRPYQVEERHRLSGKTGTTLWGSADGTSYALGGDGFVYAIPADLPVVAALHAFMDTPQAAWQPADLATALAAGPVVAGYPATGQFYRVLVGCLEHRFGSDVGVARDGARIGDDEIGISRSGESTP